MSAYKKYEFLGEFYDDLDWEYLPPKKWWKTLLSKFSGLIGFLTVSIMVPVIIVPPVASVLTQTGIETLKSAYEIIPSDVPSVPKLPLYSKVYDNAGNEYAQFFSENRILVSYEDIPTRAIEALVATEDKNFFDHSGVDGAGIVRAAITNYEAGRTVEGASTITQQLVENLKKMNASDEEQYTEALGSTMATKLIEAKTAMELEEQMSKEEILETYFNTVYFGSGTYGIGSAARKYFNKNVTELTLTESALLVGIVNSPSSLDPTKHPVAALDRRNLVLKRMYSAGYVGYDQYTFISKTPILLNVSATDNGCYTSDYPIYCQLVKEEILSNPLYGETSGERANLLAEGGLKIDTAMDSSIMDVVNKQIVDALGTNNRVAGTAAVIEPGTGKLVAIGQNHQWGKDTEQFQTEIVYASASRGQPGSTFKPVVIAAGLAANQKVDYSFSTYSPYTSSILDNPPGGYDNDGGYNFGTISVEDAVRQSVNIWFVKLVEKVGVQNAVAEAKKIGIFDSLSAQDISSRSGSFALGAWEVTPIEMASVYSTFAAAGTTCKPVIITKVTDTRTGEVYQANEGNNCYEGMTNDDAKYMTNVLQEPFKRGGTATKFPLSGGREAIGKTGTTNNFGAAWFVGATPQYTTAVWLGDPRGANKYPLNNVQAFGRTFANVYGADISGPIWNGIMESILKDEPNVPFSSIQPSSTNQFSTINLLPTPPNVAGLNVTQAVSMLEASGWKVVVDKETNQNLGANMVINVYAQDEDTAEIKLSNESDTGILGKKVTVETDPVTGDRYLVVDTGKADN